MFLFGGGFEKGDPTKDLHGPDYFMMKDVIFVTTGYRLGPFGEILRPTLSMIMNLKYFVAFRLSTI